MKNLVLLFLWLVCFCALVMCASCHTSHVERFRADKDSLSYFRNGNIEMRWH